jgi:hypothetical protein
LTGATGGAGISYSSGTTLVIPVFSGPHVDQPLVLIYSTIHLYLEDSKWYNMSVSNEKRNI